MIEGNGVDLMNCWAPRIASIPPACTTIDSLEITEEELTLYRYSNSLFLFLEIGLIVLSLRSVCRIFPGPDSPFDGPLLTGAVFAIPPFDALLGIRSFVVTKARVSYCRLSTGFFSSQARAALEKE